LRMILSNAMRSNDEFNVARVQGIWIREKLYEHQSPIKAGFLSIRNAGINEGDYDAIVSDCRTLPHSYHRIEISLATIKPQTRRCISVSKRRKGL
jgi:hypothetical protein